VSFLSWFALGVALFAVVPYLAHRLRRRKSDDKPFAFARLVPPTEPQARRRSELTDKSLFGLRALSVLLLALLGATPFVRCSRLSLDRGGASVALVLVVDDSMSMRAKDGGESSRFTRALAGARQLLSSTREGDAVAVVLAGSPPRVALAASTDVHAARSTLDTLAPSDRATDIDGALAMARSLVASLPQQDKRIVLLSDLADGTDTPLPDDPSLWVPMPELPSEASDCAVLSADRSPKEVRVELACSPKATAEGREIELRGGDRVLAKAKAPGGPRASVVLPIDPRSTEDLDVVMTGSDAIAEDDRAAVVLEGSATSIGVVGDTVEEVTATGGAPVVEQALAALRTDLDVRPLADLPDKVADLRPYAGLVFDDPPGFTPEARRVIDDYLARGGVVLLALGPRAGRAPLGAGFTPLLGTVPTWETAVSVRDKGVKAGEGPLGESAQSLTGLDARGRAELADDDARAYSRWLSWSDGPLFLGQREIGKGEAMVVSLPFALDQSDLPLRPGFLAILDAFVARARARLSPRRSEAGASITVADAAVIKAPGGGTITHVREGAVTRAVLPEIGRYVITVQDRTEVRVVAPVPRELSLRPRAAPQGGHAKVGAAPGAKLDISWVIALGLLVLFGAEIVMRVFVRTDPATS
jgi:hypothetical protein